MAHSELLNTVGAPGWLLLLLAIAAYLGPGMALTCLLRVGRRPDVTQSIALALPLSIAATAVSLSLLNLVRAPLPTPIVWALCAGGWTIYAICRQLEHETSMAAIGSGAARLDTVALWLAVAATGVVGVWALRGVVVQPGSDGYHHTLIAQEISDLGMLPVDLLPLTPLATFTYHFGYHGFVATINWLTGIPVVALVPLLAQLLKAGAALAAAFLTEALGGRRIGAVVAATITGLVAVFPAYFVNWGRNTQLAGLLILAVLLGVVWLWAQARPAWPAAILIALLAVGLALAHYRVTLMAGLGCGLLIGAQALAGRWNRSEWRRRALHMAGIGLIAGLLGAPWLWHLWTARQVGYAAPIEAPQAQFFQLERMGGLVLTYPTNPLVLALLGLAMIWSAWRRNLAAGTMTIWFVLLYLLSQPWLVGQYMDTLTILTSLYVPGAPIIGLAAGELAGGTSSPQQRRRWAVLGTAAVLALFGGRALSQIVEYGAPYVRPEDLVAVAWVRDHTPPDARFMVNTFRFSFMPDYVHGSDAGSWLPVLAKRSVVTAPMVYPVERNIWPDYEERINTLADMSEDLASPAALARLRQEGITYVFIGARGGPIDPQTLLNSPEYQLEFEDGPVYVFRLRPAPASPASPGEESRLYLPALARNALPPPFIRVTEDGLDKTQPALAPDNGSVVYRVAGPAGSVDLFWQKVPGGLATNLTSTPAVEEETPVFAPNGLAVAFSTRLSGDWDVYLIDVDGRNLRAAVAATGSNELQPSFTPDGTRLLFSSDRSDGNGDIYITWLGSPDWTQLTRGTAMDRFPVAGQHGDTVVFRREQDGNSDIYTMRIDGSDIRRLTRYPAFDHYPAATPAHSGIVYALAATGAPSQLWQINRGGGSHARFDLNWPWPAGDPRLSADGRWLAFAAPVDIGGTDIVLYPFASPLQQVGQTGFAGLGQDCGWEAGVLAYGWGRAWQTSRDLVYLAWLKGWVDGCLARGYQIAHVNDVPLGYAALLVYERLPDAKYLDLAKEAADYLWNKAPRTSDGTLIHLEEAVWDDTLIGVVPFLVEMAQASGEDRYLDEAVEQVRRHAAHLQDGATGLYRHAWEAPSGGYSGPFYWARGNGWALVAGTAVLRALSLDHPQRAAVLQIFQRQAGALLAQQAADGLWSTIVTRPDFYRETSGSALIAAGLGEGVARGWLETSLFARALEQARLGVWGQISANGVAGGVSAPTGPMLLESAYNSIATGSFQRYGQGAVLLMGSTE